MPGNKPVDERKKLKEVRKDVIDTIKKFLDDEGHPYYWNKDQVTRFVDNPVSIVPAQDLMISFDNTRVQMDDLVERLNGKIEDLGAHAKRDEFGTVYISMEIDDSMLESSGELYHLSSRAGLNELTPSIPDNFLTKNGFEENKTPRVCFAPSIDKCLIAMSQNLTNKEFYVYIPDGEYKTKKPSVKEVPDSKVTGEVWILEPVKLKCIGKVRVIGDNGKEYKYKYGNNTATLYGWKYESMMYEAVGPDETYVKHDLEVPELAMPGMEHEILSLQELLDQTDPKKIYITSDWHWFRGAYKKQGRNPINDMELLKWCKEHIKDEDVFIYLGDVCFRFASKEHIEQSMKYMAQIPGTKVLVLGNHDTLLGQDFYTGCGFKYVVEEFEWKNYIFTHRPVDVRSKYNTTYWNIHGHIHDSIEYFTSDGKHNINVYPYFFNNKPTTMDYIENHLNELVKDHKWINNGMYGEGGIGAFTGAHNANILASIQYMNEAANNPDKPNVFFSDKIDSYTIAYMASLFATKLRGRIAIKIHCGEEGNENYLKPSLYRDLIKYTHGHFVDSNVAYKSKRATAEGHKATAKAHGFYDVGYFDVLDEEGNMNISVPVQNAIKREFDKKKNSETYLGPIHDGPHLSEVNVGSHLGNYDSMIVVTHFKGHPMAGYGGAVKNIGMGVPSGKTGKLQVHGKAFAREPIFLERLVESATTVENFFYGNIVYVNVLKNLSVDCDCEADAHKPTMKDIGIVVSDNLYAVEQASLDLIRVAPKNKDLMERISSRGGFHQLEYMEALGLKPANGYALKDLSGHALKLEEAASILDDMEPDEDFTPSIFTSGDFDEFMDDAAYHQAKEEINEGAVFNHENVYYNMEAFNSGAINICWVTGFAGSGKSTYAKNLSNGKDIVHIELDSICWTWAWKHETNLNIKYDEVATSFINKYGKLYAKSIDELKAMDPEEKSNYFYQLTKAYINFIRTYANSHKSKKFIAEGIQLLNTEPAEYKDDAFCVIGVSKLVSTFRAAKRDAERRYDDPKKKDVAKSFIQFLYEDLFKDPKYTIKIIKNLDKFIDYFSNQPTTVTESGKYDDLPDEVFGIPEERKFPLDTPEHVKSAIKLFYKAPEEKRPELARRIEIAAKTFGVPISETTLCYKYIQANHEKEAAMHETKRSNLPDSAFGIPEDRKYPLDSAKHVNSAIHLFGHAEEGKKKSLARRIRAAAKKYNITIPEGSKVSEYLHEGGLEDIIPHDVDTIVFDLGGVLLGDDTHHIMITSLAMSDHLAHVTADHIEELLFGDDNATAMKNYTMEEVKDYFRKNSPKDIIDYADAIFDAIGKIVYKYPYVDELIRALRYKGYKIYYLSNWTRWSYEPQKEVHESITNQLDGGLYDFDCPYSKPDKRIYETFFKRFNLDPEKCFFFDDKAQNLIGAEAAGMRGALFNPLETPRVLLDDIMEIPSSANNTVIIDTGVALEAAELTLDNWDKIEFIKDPEIYNADDIAGWLQVPSAREGMVDSDPINKDPDRYACSLGDAVHLSTNSEIFDNQNAIEKIIYVHNKPGDEVDKVPIGQISIHPDRTYDWDLQYPVEYINGHFRSGLKEYSMAAVNPVMGLMRPFIIKAGIDTGSAISPKQYALSPDIISDKYLVIDENAQLKVVDADYFNDYNIEGVYEFVGNKNLINRINEAYKTGKYVDNTFFYTTLTGKPMLCEDQIDFDSNFKKIDVEAMVENVITNMATTKMQFMEANSYYGPAYVPVVEAGIHQNIPFLDKYNKHGDLSVREDFDGYYYYCSTTNKRSRSVGSMSMLTEAMIKSVLRRGE